MKIIRYAIVRIEIEAVDVGTDPYEAAQRVIDNCDYAFVYDDGLVKVVDTEILDCSEDHPLV